MQLEERLRQEIEGEVRFEPGDRALYATDASNYRQVPIGVVIPKTRLDIEKTVRACHDYKVPLLSRGGGTSLAGQCCNQAVVMDMSKYYNKVIEINSTEEWARVQPGLVLDRLQDAAKKYQLIFGPDPATHNHCTLGGMLGNNSCGAHSVLAGRTADNTLELEVMTYDGTIMKVGPTSDGEYETILRAGGRKAEIYRSLKDLITQYGDKVRTRYPRIPRRVSGYNLDELLPENEFHVARALVGSESTCVVILEAKLRLVKNPRERALLLVGYPSIYEAGDHIPLLMAQKPIALEAVDDRLVNFARKKGLGIKGLDELPEGKGWLIIEFGGDKPEDAERKARETLKLLHADGVQAKVVSDREQQDHVWKLREAGLPATARPTGNREGDTWEGWEDSAVPPDKVGAYLRDLRKLFDKYGYGCALYGHFGQGCIHTRIDFDFRTPEGVDRYKSFMHEAAHLVVSYGGSLSGEHGDGQSRAALLPIMFGDELVQAFERFKSIWDPDWKMNPGKVVRPYRIDENLRLGPKHQPDQVLSYFRYPEDNGSFARATLRCVGVGECRKTETGIMCPSYMVTGEEKHSTRGRARLLYEMLEGEVLDREWKSKAVAEALDLCLACKGCKHECPTNVDMATYKAEFRAHYYRGRLRPRHAYAMGLINVWAQMASHFPRLVNFLSQTPLLRDLVRWAGGISQRREVPRFANETFRHWFRKQSQPLSAPSGTVILWCDTFTNHFNVDIAQSTYRVLRALGYRVGIPREELCCGRPLYDFGMLDRAKNYLLRVVNSLESALSQGLPIVVLEPSCLAVFRDEAQGLFPGRELFLRLSRQSYSLAEFVQKKSPDFVFERISKKALVHKHCHEKAVVKNHAEREFLERLGLEAEFLDDGCCGMAGSFGFEAGHFDVSQSIGERRLLPSVRSASAETLVVADGFSCREQVRQSTGRMPLHTAQVAELAISLAARRGRSGLSFAERKQAHSGNAQASSSLL